MNTECFFFGLHPKFWTKIFCIRRELENRDSDKSHKIWAKLYSTKFFSGGTATLSMNDVNKQGCPIFYSSWAKYSCVSVSRATIAAVIKVMFSCELVQKFYVMADLGQTF